MLFPRPLAASPLILSFVLQLQASHQYLNGLTLIKDTEQKEKSTHRLSRHNTTTRRVQCSPPLKFSCPCNSASNFETSTRPPLRVGVHPPIAAAATTACSYTSAQNTTWTNSTVSSPPQHRMASCASLYEVLGIPMGATSQDIKTAYRRLARTLHPDVVAIEGKDSTADEFIKIHAAYSTLSDPLKRAVYDQRLFQTRRRPLTAVSGYSGYSGRNWETDQCW
ncbi:hypothetical protein WN943_021131 [Citrus x changshan-huyou]